MKTRNGILKWFATVLAFVLTVSLAAAALAVDYPVSGTCGEGLTWSLREKMYLTISGTGAMDDYNETERPWAIPAVGIRTIDISEGVTKIGNEAFSTMTFLEKVTIPSTVTHIGENAFYFNLRLKTVHYAGTIAEAKAIVISPGNMWLTGTTWKCSDGTTDGLGDVSGTCGDNITWSIKKNKLTLKGSGPMYDYTVETQPWYAMSVRLKSAVISQGITHVGANAFRDMPSLESVKLPSSLTGIGAFAFSNIPLKSLTLPKGLETIGEGGICWCRYLKKITIPDSVVSIGTNAFADCYQLATISLPKKGTMQIGELAFKGTKVSKMVFPEGMTTIPYGCLSSCESLKSVTIPASVTLIEDYAFGNCPKLKTVQYKGSKSAAQQMVIGEINEALQNASWKYKGK